ncbi:hypothetical protein DCAR_0830435 [Daucus carota subsp. sativus]|uniref:Fe2OG dioxygenase domain-containing protein n=1 Tax=Daucus carota subsp. sativus TaxID=79200 RepID=A0A175YKQ4_DAUCS|nr:PREDICTED: protein DMR6-LIKE OXYGENASE 1-like [Daucus carota subsp. sativus]WOH10958.1 hypothetical protein DCAR_0830435 [Daucus carota subsp. sativus]
MNCLQSWPAPVVRVQSLSDSGMQMIPDTYVRKPCDRPSSLDQNLIPSHGDQIPVIDLQELFSGNPSTLSLLHTACSEWGFFQVVNHGVSHRLMEQALEVWRQFFHLPVEAKQAYANSPTDYEGYGSRLGVEANAKLDWSDYYFLNYLPLSLRNQNKWPSNPSTCRKLTAEYSEALVKICERLTKILSENLGLESDHIQKAFGGKETGGCMRVSFYPKCPQPDLTLGLSPHSDPGGITLLFADDHVEGLQVRKDGNWVTVKPVPNAFIVNLGDQMQVISNGKYKSIEHRVIVNSTTERVSLAFFYNPKEDMTIAPAQKLISNSSPALYPPMSFREYRSFIRTKGPSGKSQVESLKSP